MGEWVGERGERYFYSLVVMRPDERADVLDYFDIPVWYNELHEFKRDD